MLSHHTANVDSNHKVLKSFWFWTVFILHSNPRNGLHACMIGSGGGRTLSKAFITSPYFSLERRSHSWASTFMWLPQTKPNRPSAWTESGFLCFYLMKRKPCKSDNALYLFATQQKKKKIIAENIERQMILVLRVAHASKMIQEKCSIHPVSAASLSYFQCSLIFSDSHTCL